MKATDWKVICRVEDIPRAGARRVARVLREWSAASV